MYWQLDIFLFWNIAEITIRYFSSKNCSIVVSSNIRPKEKEIKNYNDDVQEDTVSTRDDMIVPLAYSCKKGEGRDDIFVFIRDSSTKLKYVQVFAGLRLGVSGPHLAQQSLHPEAGGRPGAPVFFERGPAVGQRGFRSFAHRR